LSVFTELQTRGLEDCFIACFDGLKGLPEAPEAVLSKTQVQLSVLSIKYGIASGTCLGKKVMVADLRAIHGVAALAEAERALERFAERWNTRSPTISPSWLVDWERLTVLFDDSPTIRHVIYTTNAIESLHYVCISAPKDLSGTAVSGSFRTGSAQ
jgi:putative transposase